MSGDLILGIWIFTALIGLSASIMMLFVTRLQLTSITSDDHRWRRQARRNLRNELGRGSMFAINLGIGLLALAVPSSGPVSILAYLFIIKNLIQAVNVVMDARASLIDIVTYDGPLPRTPFGIGDPTERDAARDLARDQERDTIRDEARDHEHDLETH